MSGEVAVTLLNRSDKQAEMTLEIDSTGIDAGKGYTMRDLWRHKEEALSTLNSRRFEVPAHGVVTLKITGKSLPFNIFQREK